MTDRAGFLASCADCFSAMCVFHAAAILIFGTGWGVHLFWLLLWAAVCSLVFTLLLGKPREVPFLTALTGALVLTGFGLFALTAAAPPRFGVGLVIAVGAGMAAGLPLYYALHRPKVLSHLTQLDLMIGVLLFLLVTKDALGFDDGTVVLAALVLLLDAAAAVGLRMTEDGHADGGGGALRASMTALAGAAALALAVWLLSAILSGSGAVTGGILRVIGAFFAAVGRAVEAAVGRLARLLAREVRYDAVDPGPELPSLAGAEAVGGSGAVPINTTVIGIVLCVLLVGAAVFIALRLRRRAVTRAAAEGAYGGEVGVRRTGGTAGELWRRLRAAAAFRWTAFLHRDTPAGLLVFLERRGRRAGTPRAAGETMRAFLGRMDPAGGLAPLADALDRQYYGGGDGGMTPRHCRALRRRFRKTHRRGKAPQKPIGGSL